VLTFVLAPRVEHIALELIPDAYKEAPDVRVVKFDQFEGRIRLYSAETPAVEFVNESWLIERLDDRGNADILSNALRAPAYRAVAIARDRRPVEIRTLDLRAYVLACSVMEEQIWKERGRFMTAFVRRASGFESEQEEMLTEFDPERRGSPPQDVDGLK
jgi:hypothetical protein